MQRTLILILVTCLLTGGAIGDMLHVPGDHDTIQDAIDASSEGDTILIGPGRWMERLDLGGRSITLKGSTGPDATIVDGTGKGRAPTLTCDDGENNATRIVDLTLVGGKGKNMIPRGEIQGGGVLVVDASPIFIRCMIRDNHAQYGSGGGASIMGGSPIFIDCTFKENRSDHIGGGLLVKEGQPRFINCTFTGNVAPTGAGLYAWRDTTSSFLGCRFLENEAEGHGGAVAAWHAEMEFVQCHFSENKAPLGGRAVSALGMGPDLSQCSLGDGEDVETHD